MFEGTIEQMAAQVEQILSVLAPGAVCIAQAWDERIDCLLRLPDGTVVGEMVRLSELSEQRVRAAGERLCRRAEGMDVTLVDEIPSPIRILPRPVD